jgi:hypothetical protein
MTKVLQWIGKLMVGTILVTGITVFVTWTTVSSYIDKLLKTYHLEAVQPGFADMLGGMMGSLKGDASIQQQETKGEQVTPAGSQEPTLASPTPGAPTDSGTRTGDEPNPLNSTYSGSGASATPDGKKDPVQVQSQSESEGLQAGGAVVMSAEDIIKRKNNLSAEEKQQILALLVDKLPEADMQRLTALLEGGLTAAELQEMEKSLKTYLDGNEYANLLHMINKYE